MANNGKDTKQKRHISRRVHLERKNENCKMNKIDWCEGRLQLSYIATRNVGENDLNTRSKYIMVRLEH